MSRQRAHGATMVQRLPALRRLRRGLCGLGAIAVALLILRAVSGGGSELAGAAHRLARPALPWVLVAIACELLSYLLYAAAQRRLLGLAGSRLGVRWLACLAVSAQALCNFLPAGYVAANLLNFRELGRRGLSPMVRGWVLVVTSALYIGMLACLTVLGGELAGSRIHGGLEEAQLGAIAFLVVLVALCLAARILLVRGTMRLPESWRTRLAAVPLRSGIVAIAAALFAGSWLADAGCLVAAVRAVGAAPAWDLVPMAYCAAQLVSFLPITPGGLGLVEGSLTVTLLAGGGAAAPVLAAVLLYRIISYWATLPCGALGYLVVRRTSARREARAEFTSLERDAEPRQPARHDRAPGGDRPVLVLEG